MKLKQLRKRTSDSDTCSSASNAPRVTNVPPLPPTSTTISARFPGRKDSRPRFPDRQDEVANGSSLYDSNALLSSGTDAVVGSTSSTSRAKVSRAAQIDA